LFLVAWQVNRRIYPLDYEWRRIIKLTIITGLVLSIGWLVPESIILAMGVKGLLLIGFWGFLIAWRFFTPQETRAIKKVVRKNPITQQIVGKLGW
jgi:hypothetical protein